MNYGDGGEFLATVYSSAAYNSQGQVSRGLSGYYQGSFYTFCCSVNIGFTPGSPYQVTGVAPNSTLPTGFGTTEGAWLFNQYWNDTSPTVPSPLNTGYVPGHAALVALGGSAGSTTLTNATPSSFNIPHWYGTPNNTWVSGAIQAQIWESLGQTPTNGYTPSYTWLADWAQAVFNWSAAYDTFIGSNPNGVTLGEMQLAGTNGDPAQPQLYIPSGVVGVPCLVARAGQRVGVVAAVGYRVCRQSPLAATDRKPPELEFQARRSFAGIAADDRSFQIPGDCPARHGLGVHRRPPV